MKQNNTFLAVVWEKARPFEAEVREKLSKDFTILAETEMFWPKHLFTKKLRAFYGFGSRFTWWNKARKCGRGAFKVIVFKDESPTWKRAATAYGNFVDMDVRVNDDKRVCRLMTGHRNVFHASLNAEETERESHVLFGCSIEDWLAARVSGAKTEVVGRSVNVLCLKWGHYYTADDVNRLYAGVSRNLARPFRFVCVTDDKTGIRPEVECVPFPADPGVIGRKWPNIFVKLLLFRDGFADLEGPTLFLDVDLLVTGPLDKFFDYKPGEFCIIHNWVERRKRIFRRLPDIGNSSCFRFEAGKSGGVYDFFLAMKDVPAEAHRFKLGSQKFQTYAMMKTGKVNWWPDDWVCSFKRQLVPIFPLNKIFTPRRPPKSASIVAFHGQPDLPQALGGYYVKCDRPVAMHLTCKPTPWILEYWHE